MPRRTDRDIMTLCNMGPPGVDMPTHDAANPPLTAGAIQANNTYRSVGKAIFG
jgi:hypothetical protein